MNEITRRLLTLKENIEGAQAEAQRLKGVLETYQTQLKTEFGCGTVEEAETELQALEEETKTLSEELNQDLEDLEERWTLLTKDADE